MYKKLCLEDYNFIPTEHDIFWNVDSSYLNADLTLNQKEFTKYFLGLDMPLFYVYFNDFFCLLLINSSWNYFIKNNNYKNELQSIIYDILTGLNNDNKECVFVASDEEEDYSFLKPHILNCQSMKGFKSIKDVIEYFNIEGIKEISDVPTCDSGYIYKSWN